MTEKDSVSEKKKRVDLYIKHVEQYLGTGAIIKISIVASRQNKFILIATKDNLIRPQFD